ncbi:unnamed protein product [Chondrus crispus]|uniref:Uncharacterized protein n=1 Tax=Chondrus crispus TaxID=2769 RepID=R7QBU0_CHOCR|nr:unnamed protein product [Chondrus crispus]CDF34896.1 unnamed protein product [Chondrus crispus]|eukprot:XP_005714715.1 unnamed protein product [Chondrus crispus]
MSPAGRFCRVISQRSGSNTPRKFKALDSNESSQGGSADSQEEDYKDDEIWNEIGNKDNIEGDIAVALKKLDEAQPWYPLKSLARTPEREEKSDLQACYDDTASRDSNSHARTLVQDRGEIKLNEANQVQKQAVEPRINNPGQAVRLVAVSISKRSSPEHYPSQEWISHNLKGGSRRLSKESDEEKNTLTVSSKNKTNLRRPTRRNRREMPGALCDDTTIQVNAGEGVSLSPKSEPFHLSRSFDGQALLSRGARLARAKLRGASFDLPEAEIDKRKNTQSQTHSSGDEQVASSLVSPGKSFLEFLQKKTEKVRISSPRTSGELLEGPFRKNTPRWQKSGRDFETLSQLKSRKGAASPLQVYTTMQAEQKGRVDSKGSKRSPKEKKPSRIVSLESPKHVEGAVVDEE